MKKKTQLIVRSNIILAQQTFNMVRQNKKITCVSANPTDPKVFFAIFEQALLKSECVPFRN